MGLRYGSVAFAAIDIVHLDGLLWGIWIRQPERAAYANVASLLVSSSGGLINCEMKSAKDAQKMPIGLSLELQLLVRYLYLLCFHSCLNFMAILIDTLHRAADQLVYEVASFVCTLSAGSVVDDMLRSG